MSFKAYAIYIFLHSTFYLCVQYLFKDRIIGKHNELQGILSRGSVDTLYFCNTWVFKGV